MKKLLPILAASAFFFFSCAAPPGVREVRVAYERFAQAVLAEDVTALHAVAPFLAKLETADALVVLRKTLEGKPSYRIHILDERNALVQLADNRRTSLPFVKVDSGQWTISDTFRHIQFIDFVPAKTPINP